MKKIGGTPSPPSKKTFLLDQATTFFGDPKLLKSSPDLKINFGVKNVWDNNFGGPNSKTHISHGMLHMTRTYHAHIYHDLDLPLE